MSLKLPSMVLKQAGATTRREFASIVCRSLQQTNECNITHACFETPEEAQLYIAHVQQRINLSVPCDKAEECIVLPPLFLRSQEKGICQAQDLFLVLYQTGPIIPVVRVRSANQLMGDTQLLSHLIRLYEALSSERATMATIDSILTDTL